MEMIFLVYLKAPDISPLTMLWFSLRNRVWDGNCFCLERGKGFMMKSYGKHWVRWAQTGSLTPNLL